MVHHLRIALQHPHEHRSDHGYKVSDEAIKTFFGAIHEVLSQTVASAPLFHLKAGVAHIGLPSQDAEAPFLEALRQKLAGLPPIGGKTPYSFSVEGVEDISKNRKMEEFTPRDLAAHPHDDSMWVEDPHAPEEELQKSKKDAEQMYGADHPGTPTKKEHLAWAYGKMPNENWSLWTVRHHRAAPQDFTPEIKSKIEHFAGSQHIPEIANVRFEKHHSLQDGLNILDAAEKQYISRQKGSLQLASKPKTANKIMDFGDGYAWWSLGRGSCSKEGKAMGHCGNVPTETEGDDVVSLRKEHVLGGKKYYEPHLTFIRNGDIFGEMKGRGNEKPAQHYHDKIVALLNKTQAHPLGGGYMQGSNFNLDDLSPEHRQQVKLQPLQWDSGASIKNKKLKLASKELPPEALTQALGDGDSNIRTAAISHPSATAEHITQALRDEDGDVRRAAIKHPLATSEHVTQALGDENWSVRKAAISHPSATAEHITRALGDEDSDVRKAAIKHPLATSEHVTRALGDEDSDVRKAAIKHPSATAEHVTRALGDTNEYVREAAIKHPSATAEHVTQALGDKDETVREAAISHPSATAEHITQALGDKDETVREAAISHPSATAEHVTRALGDMDWAVRRAAISHPSATSEHVTRALGDKDEYVRKAAISHPSVTAEHVTRALGDKDEYVREAAQKRAIEMGLD